MSVGKQKGRFGAAHRACLSVPETFLRNPGQNRPLILYAFDEGFELSELACQLNMPEERIFDVLKELADTDYLQIQQEDNDEFCLELRGK